MARLYLSYDMPLFKLKLGMNNYDNLFFLPEFFAMHFFPKWYLNQIKVFTDFKIIFKCIFESEYSLLCPVLFHISVSRSGVYRLFCYV